MRQTKAAPDDAAIAEEIANLVRARAGRHVEVLGLSTEHQVANASADQVGRVAVPVETTNDLGRVWIDQAPGNFVCVDDGLGRIFGEVVSLAAFPLTEVGIYHSGHRIPKAQKSRAGKLLPSLSNMRS